MRFLVLISIATVAASPAMADETPIPDCQVQIHEIVGRYLPAALGFPPRSARRSARLDALLSAYELLRSTMRPFEAGECDIVLKHEMSDLAVKIEGR